MTCETIRQMLAVSAREWREADRLQVEAHLASCPACTIVAHDYAAQAARLAALPRYSLSISQQQAILDRINRDPLWPKWSRLFSNAVGMAALGLVILALAWLVSHSAPVSLTMVATQVLTPTLTLTLSPAPPSPAPPPTVLMSNGQFATPTPVTPEPMYATQYAAQQATQAADRTTAIARATSLPFPTARPVISLAGQPASAVVQRGELSLELHLPKDTYLAGERGQAEVAAVNAGSEPVFIRDIGVTLLDSHGDKPEPWPWAPMPLYDGLRGLGLDRLGPGEIITRLLEFQIPLTPLHVVSETYALWAEMEFSRVLPTQPDSSDDVWLRTETGPISIKTIMPTTSQQLTALLQIDWTGWQLQGVDANGQTPSSPLQAAIEAVYPDGVMSGPLPANAAGIWSGQWGNDRSAQDQQPIVVRAWVAAPGYVTAAITQVLSADGSTSDLDRRFGATEPITRQVFASLAAAQAATDFPLYRLTRLPVETILENVLRVETSPIQGQRRTSVTQVYRLPDGTQLKLIQVFTAEKFDAAQWGLGRFTPESQAISLGKNSGYVVQRFGQWLLDWQSDGFGFELKMPVPAVSLAELLELAAGVQPLR